MVVVQPANHGEGRSAEGAEGRTATEEDTSREREREREGGRGSGEGRRWVEELCTETGRPLLVLFIRDTPHAADTRILLF